MMEVLLDQRGTEDASAPIGHPGAEFWIASIMECWRMGVESIIRTGQRLNEAKAALEHGEWEQVRSQLPFGERQVQMLMAIASDARLSNPQYIALLPASWGTIYDLTRLTDDEMERGFQQHIIRPDMIRADIGQLRPLLRASSSDGGVESKTGRPDRSPLEHASGTASEGGHAEATGKDALAGFAQADKSAQLTAGDGRIPEQPETAYSTDRQVAGVAPGPSEANAGAHLREGCEPSADQEEDRPARPDPLPPQMPGGGLAIAHRRDESDTDPREFFPTPPWATRALVERVLRHLRREGQCQFQTAWEPACGEGHMSEVLREYFRNVEASDAFEYVYRGNPADTFACDFLTAENTGSVDWIITNPPFRKSTDFVLKALDLAGTGVAMFVRLSWIEGVTRYEKLLRDQPPSLLSIFTERAPLHKARWEPEGSTFTAYAWLVWIKGMPPQPPFWIPPGCRQVLAKPDDVKRFGKTEVEEQEAA